MSWWRKLIPWKTPEERRIIRLRRNPLATIAFEQKEMFGAAFNDALTKAYGFPKHFAHPEDVTAESQYARR